MPTALLCLILQTLPFAQIHRIERTVKHEGVYERGRIFADHIELSLQSETSGSPPLTTSRPLLLDDAIDGAIEAAQKGTVSAATLPQPVALHLLHAVKFDGALHHIDLGSAAGDTRTSNDAPQAALLRRLAAQLCGAD